jgi:hypothetical protein
MNDEQRGMTRSGAQPEGMGPFFRSPALQLAYVPQVHGAHCALTCKKMTAVAAAFIVLTGPNTIPPIVTVYSVDKLISEARRLAADYRRATGKPIPGVSIEIAQNDAARLLGLELAAKPQAGHDAIGRGKRDGKKIQIKGRVIFDERKSGQRIGELRLDREWDSVVLVLMDEEYEPYEIYEAEREEILHAFSDGEGSRRNKRGALSVAKFKVISELVWTREEGELEDTVWDNQSDH